jgi:hypothetical protein
MPPLIGTRTAVVVRLLLVVCALAAATVSAHAQAWVPPGRIGLVSFVYQDITNTNHRLSDGSLFDGYDSVSRGVLVNLEYAFTDRLSMSFGVPYLGSKYTGPEPSFFGLPIDDCLCWNHGWQDFGFTARYNLFNGASALTPSISLGVPTHNYDYYGEAALGRNLKEIRLQLDAGRRLDAISDRLSVSARYSYAIVEEVLDLPNNRSNIALEADFLAMRKLVVRGGVSWQRSHGGLRSDEILTEEQIAQYDRIVKDNNFHVNGGLSYSLPKVDVFASYVHYAAGTDTHVGHAITAGLSIPFER